MNTPSIISVCQGSFRHAQTGNVVSREELMMVLVDLESLHIRALHSQSAEAVSLRAAVLEGAESLPTGRHANNVEICMCPANYEGDSCQVLLRQLTFIASGCSYLNAVDLVCAIPRPTR